MTNKEVIFNSLSFGDLILAKRSPNTRKIAKGHKNGPFLVLENKDGILKCLYATSKKDVDSLFKIEKNDYNLDKDTYITDKIRNVTINEFLTSLYYLNDKEKKNIIKTLYINGFENLGFLYETKLEVGDIIQTDGKYLIVDEKDDKYIVMGAKYDEDKSRYQICPLQSFVFSKNEKYKRVAFLLDEEIDRCRYIKQKYKTKKVKTNFNNKNQEAVNVPLAVGNLIVYKNLFYYLYYDFGDKKISFSVSKNKTSRAKKITIDGESYYANFDLKRDFDSNQENVLFVATATEEEQQLIKMKRDKKR